MIAELSQDDVALPDGDSSLGQLLDLSKQVVNQPRFGKNPINSGCYDFLHVVPSRKGHQC